jgi:hypothetical protein
VGKDSGGGCMDKSSGGESEGYQGEEEASPWAQGTGGADARSSPQCGDGASPVNLATLEALRSRRDKAAAKERRLKLPNHGRQVAPHGLNKLPAGFSTRTTGGPIAGASARGDQARSAPVPGAARYEPPAPQLPAVSPQRPEQRAIAQVGTAAKPSLTGVVQVELGVLLDIALLAGMDLAAVLALTGSRRDPKAGKREEATLAAVEHCASRELARQVGAMMGLSPIVRRAQSVTAPVAPHRGAEVAEKAFGAVAIDRVLEAGSLGHRFGGAPTTGPSRPQHAGLAEILCGGAKVGGQVSLLDAQGQQGEGPPAGVNSYREAIAQNRFDPETLAMGAARRGFNGEGAGDAALARQMAQQDAKEQEELVVATSRDAELAMLMVAEEARARGIDREVALQAQEGSTDRSAGAGDSMKDGAKSKNKIQDGGQGEMEQALGWERQLSSGSWRGANDFAPVVL